MTKIHIDWKENKGWEIPIKKVGDHETFTGNIINETKYWAYQSDDEFFDKSTDRIIYFLIWLAIFLIAFFVWRFSSYNPSLDEQRTYILYSNGSLLKSLLNQEKTLENQMYNLDTRIIKLQKCIELNNSSGSLNINNCEIWIN